VTVPQLPADALADVVARALAEDVGAGDVTVEALIPADATARATVHQKAPGVLYGLAAAEAVFLALDAEARFQRLAPEGEWLEGGPALRVGARARAILSAERTALNLAQRLSGIATLTRRYVDAIVGSGARILDTRKTTPGLRVLEKAAVRAGGGHNHRMGLYDQVLIKENHIAQAGGVGEAVGRARAAAPEVPLEVEVRTLAELEAALGAGAPRVLLDNMAPSLLAEAVALSAGRAELEASGGVSLETVGEIARTGVDFISVGALTHSAPALDLSLVMEPLP